MKTVWEYSLETETLRILQCARNISVGFYRDNGFNVIPYGVGGNQFCVYFPDLPFCNISRFWGKVTSINVVTLPIKANADLISQTKKLIGNFHFPNQIIDTQRCWKEAQNDILKTIYQIMPSKKGVVKKITIYPTRFGTETSFSLVKKIRLILFSIFVRIRTFMQ